MRKGVAIGYIIALVLGVAVIALIGIWLVTSGGKLGKSSTEVECKKAISIYCIKLVSGLTSSLTSSDQTKCSNVDITVPANVAVCKSEGYVS